MKRVLAIFVFGFLCQLRGTAESVLFTNELSQNETGSVAYKNVSAPDEIVLYSGEPECTSGTRPVSITGSGNLYSPNYVSSLNYPNNADCEWLLTASSSTYYVQLLFITFSTEAYADYLRLYDGSSTSYTLLGTLSGTSTFSFTYTSSQRYMYVKFTSGTTNTYSGFSATFSTVATAYKPCSTYPCQNGGACWNYGSSSYHCVCPTGYSGTNCQTYFATACSSYPCQNGGTCTNSGSSYYCTCPSGYTGTNCQTSSSVCSPNPCLNGGTCSTTSGCTCSAGYTGTYCANSICSSTGTELTTRGMINSPNFPSYYTNNANCHWLLTAYASNGVISLSFINTFYTESSADYVKIYDGSSTSDTLLDSLSGYHSYSSYGSGSTYTSTGRHMYVTFTSDSSSSSYTYTGFNATFSGSPPSYHGSSSVAMAIVAAIVPLWLTM